MPNGSLVFLAVGGSDVEVALQLLTESWTRDPAARDRFAAEAGTATGVQPFCVARLLDAGLTTDHVYLVSEYVPGRSLLEKISEDGALGGSGLEMLAIGCVTGLAAIHEAGLVHGNFGPEHVIMGPDGPRVIDYGITPPYGAATPSSDMLAWAQTMVFAATGRPPGTVADLDMLPLVLRRAVSDSLSGDKASRPTARAVLLDLLDDPLLMIEGTPPAEALAEGTRCAASATGPAARQAPWEGRTARVGRHGRSVGEPPAADALGYRDDAPAFPGAGPGYAGDAAAYSDEAPSLPSDPPGYPGGASAYSNGAASHADQAAGYADHAPGYPDRSPGYPGQPADYSDDVANHADAAPGYPDQAQGHGDQAPGSASSEPGWAGNWADEADGWPHEATGGYSGGGDAHGEPGYAASWAGDAEHAPRHAEDAPAYAEDEPDYAADGPEYAGDGPGYAESTPGRRGGSIPIIAAVVVVVAVGLVFVHKMQAADTARPQAAASHSPQADVPGATATSSTDPGGTGTGTLATQSPGPTATPKHHKAHQATGIPSTLAGSWSGEAKQVNPADQFAVRLTLATGSKTGTVVYSSSTFSCTGDLALHSAAHGTLTLDQHIVKGSCVNGVVTVRKGPGGTAAFSFRSSKTGPVATGNLTKA